MIKVLIADDSAMMRKMLSEMLESSGFIEVVGIARDGEEVIKKARELVPDVITLDLNMPIVDGLTAMKTIVEESICPVIVVSSLTAEGAEITLKALQDGAFDCIEKPGGLVSRNIETIKEDLLEKIWEASKHKIEKVSYAGTDYSNRKIIKKQRIERAGIEDIKAVAIGISTGGPRVIQKVIPNLPADLNAAVFLVQHIPAHFTKTYAENLNKISEMNVIESEAGMEIEKGIVYIAKGGFQFNLYKKSNGKIITRHTSKPENRFKPSIDVMMESVLNVFDKKTIGVLMTGMGADGANAMVKIRERGGYTIAESEETAVVFGMPKEAINRGGASAVFPNDQIADEIIKAVST